MVRRLYPQELLKIAQARQQADPFPLPAPTAWPTVTVVLLSLDRLHLTQRCIESLYAHSDYPFRLLIHDDGSQPETLAYLYDLRASRDNVALSQHPARLGCAGGRNRAAAQVDTDYIFFLDNDMVCHPGWLRATMTCAVRRRADFVAPLRLNPDGSLWAHAAELVRTEDETVLEIARWFHDLLPETVQSLFGENDVRTNFVPGGAGLFSRRAFNACGGFDERYPIGFEDMDFSLKLAERGYCVWATAQALLTHDDEWLPQTAADVTYARGRYDPVTLSREAEHFRATWGVNVLPEKYARSFQQRLERKLTHES